MERANIMFNRLAEYLPTAWGGSSDTLESKGNSASAKFSVRDVLEPVEQAVKNHPGVALAAAFCIGVTVAWWIKRR